MAEEMTVAAGAQYGPTPVEVAEMVKKHVPYTVPEEAKDASNIAQHVPYLVESKTEPKTKEKK